MLWAELAAAAESRETSPATHEVLRALLANIHGGFSTLDHELHLKLLSPSSSLAERVWHEAPHPELHLCCPFFGQTALSGLTTRISLLKKTYDSLLG